MSSPNGSPQPRSGVGRRNLLMTSGAALAAAAGLVPESAFADGPKPNIIFILADDMGWHDVGFHGSDIKTPNIDALAETGARLEDFYCQQICTPTRAAFMTGRYPLRYGLQMAVIPSAGKYGLATDEWIVPQALKQAGYYTALVGKWHLGHASHKYWPGQRGFDYSYGPLIGEIDHFKHQSHGVTDWYRNGKLIVEPGYDTELLGADAVRLIDAHDINSPLFMYLAFTAPHTPYQAPKKYLDMYGGIADPLRRAYAAQITAMDDQIGKLVSALDKRKMRENTLIMFVSDNGGTRSNMFVGEAEVKGELPPDNGPYRDGKGSVYEGGTKVVALANWPGRVKPGVVNELMHIVDMYPTFAGLAGVALTKNKPLDGLDVWPAISGGKPSPRVDMVYNVEPYRAGVRKGDWKLVWTALLPPSVELFDLSKDASEKTNLAEQNPEKVKELQAWVIDLAKQSAPPLFLTEMVRLGLSHAPNFPDIGGAVD
ncbi:MAG: arylsulfatase [Hyphomicrobiales bacterium]|nr:arylsulfatase [Hyphomicrobiales bacterium]